MEKAWSFVFVMLAPVLIVPACFLIYYTVGGIFALIRRITGHPVGSRTSVPVHAK